MTHVYMKALSASGRALLVAFTPRSHDRGGFWETSPGNMQCPLQSCLMATHPTYRETVFSQDSKAACPAVQSVKTLKQYVPQTSWASFCACMQSQDDIHEICSTCRKAFDYACGSLRHATYTQTASCSTELTCRMQVRDPNSTAGERRARHCV